MIDAIDGEVIKSGIVENFKSKLVEVGMAEEHIDKFGQGLENRNDAIDVVDQLDSPCTIAAVKYLDNEGLETVLTAIPEKVSVQLQSELLLKLHPEAAKIKTEELPSIADLPEKVREKAAAEYEELRQLTEKAGNEVAKYIGCLNRGDKLREIDNYGTEMAFESGDGKLIKIAFKSDQELRKRLLEDSSKPENMTSGSVYMTREVWENLVKKYYGFKSVAEAASRELLPEEMTMVYYGTDRKSTDDPEEKRKWQELKSGLGGPDEWTIKSLAGYQEFNRNLPANGELLFHGVKSKNVSGLLQSGGIMSLSEVRRLGLEHKIGGKTREGSEDQDISFSSDYGYSARYGRKENSGDSFVIMVNRAYMLSNYQAGERDGTHLFDRQFDGKEGDKGFESSLVDQPMVIVTSNAGYQEIEDFIKSYREGKLNETQYQLWRNMSGDEVKNWFDKRVVKIGREWLSINKMTREKVELMQENLKQVYNSQFEIKVEPGRMVPTGVNANEVSIAKDLWTYDSPSVSFEEKGIKAQEVWDRLAANVWFKGKYERIGEEKKGSQGGFVALKDGEKYFVKTSTDNDRVACELLADEFYRAGGVRTVDTKMVRVEIDNDQGTEMVVGRASKWENMDGKGDYRNGFVMDCWLANWDMAAMGQANRSGDIRIDNGGALLYRARGERKGDRFGDEVNEFESMRPAYPGLSDENIEKQISDLVATFTDEKIKELVDDSHLSHDEKEILVDKMVRRRDSLLRRVHE